jgi:tryptophanyl-tRNA synthetase
MTNILENNIKLIQQFNAKPINSVNNLPDFYSFKNGLIYSHRDFDLFLKNLENGNDSAIVTGVNASGYIHIGHKAVFDTALFFQNKYHLKVFIPISDDESYVSKKAETQEAAFKNAIELAKDMLAFGFNLKNTYIIIDHVYTNIYNLAIKASKHITMSEIKAIYGYKNEDNIGLHFYPAIQAAHTMLPEELFGIKNTLVPIGPDEDSHLRAARDIASRMGYSKPAVIHTMFLPGLDGEKMSKSRNNAIFYHDSEKEILKKIMSALSGGRKTIEEHRKLGGDPEVDIACAYLKYYYMNDKDAEKLYSDYRSGKLLSGNVKNMLNKFVSEELKSFQDRFSKITDAELNKVLLKNES